MPYSPLKVINLAKTRFSYFIIATANYNLALAKKKVHKRDFSCGEPIG